MKKGPKKTIKKVAKKDRKKIIVSLCIIAITAVVVVGATRAYFSDTETSSNNIIQTGTVDINIDGNNPWDGKFDWENIKPGDTKEITFIIHNIGTYPIKLWKIIKNLTTEENGIVGPEQDWYDTNNGGQPKNDIDTAMIYEMYVDGQIAIEKEAGITLDKIKDYYMNLVKLDQATDPSYTGPNPNGSGILNPGGLVTVIQRYYFDPSKAGNWAQSDKMTFDIGILAQQVSAPEPVKQLSFINNKFVSGDWHAIADTKIGLLKYDSMAQTFNYNFIGVGLNPATNYCLIYSEDPWTGGKKILIDKGMSDANGKVSLTGSMDTGNLPYTDDGNYPIGAKIWSLSCIDYNESIQSVGWPPHNDWLFENWPGFINYTKGETSNPPATPDITTETVNINEVLSSTDWTGEPRDYSLANVNFTYENPVASHQLSGEIAATGLKPYTTYQVKFMGKPTCQYGTDGNDTTNEYIGYKGRWTVTNVACSGSGCNRTDTQYEANKISPAECIAGYLVWDFFTTDSNGNATKDVLTACSYHVLWCNGGICGVATNSPLLKYQPESGLNYHYCEANDVEGEIERGTCGSLSLETGIYDLKLVLTEESFHQTEGGWTTVLQKDINFEIE